jgi:predicted nucleic acid-binding protein
MPGSRVFDSWALLAWLLDQPAAAHVELLLRQAEERDGVTIMMSWVNVGEVYYMAVRKLDASKAGEFLKRLPSLPIQLVLPLEEDFIAAAKLKSTRRISYADGFAAALAVREGAKLVTGDPELKEMVDVVAVEWIGAGSSA